MRNDLAFIITYSVLMIFLPLVLQNNAYIGFLLILLNFWLIVAGSWNIVAGYTGQLSFAHPGLLAIGAYSSAFFVSYVHIPLLGLLVGGFSAAIAGLALGIVSLRLKGVYFVLTTFGFSVIFYEFLVSQPYITGGYSGYPTAYLLPASPYSDFLEYYYVSLALFVIFILTTYYLVSGRFGLYMRAVRDDEDAAATFGVNVSQVKVISFVLSSFWVGLMGSFYVHLIGYATPNLSDLSIMVNVVFMTVLGGIGTLLGVVVGALVVWPISVLLSIVSPTLGALLFSLITIILLKFFRSGLVGFLMSIVRKIKESVT